MKNRFLRGDLAFVLIILASALVTAQYGIPNQFWGSVTDSAGNSAPDGVLIVARISEQDVAATTTKNGFYGYTPIFYVPDPNGNREGKTIEFFVNNAKVAEHFFSNGDTDELNLVASSGFGVSSPPTNTGGNNDGGSSGGGNSGGGSSGGGVITKKSGEETTTLECEPEWQCSDWLDCVGTSQKRVCADVNSCGTNEGKPEEERSCESDELRKTKPFFSRFFPARILGAVIGPGGAIQPLGAIIFGIIIIALALIVVFIRKRIRNK